MRSSLTRSCWIVPASALAIAVVPATAKQETASGLHDARYCEIIEVKGLPPDGRAVVAGRANPGAKIVLLDGGKEIVHGEADARGEWVVIIQDPPLTPGQHELRVVQHIEGRAPVTSEQVVVAVVPEPPAAAARAPAPAGARHSATSFPSRGTPARISSSVSSSARAVARLTRLEMPIPAASKAAKKGQGRGDKVEN